MASAASSRARLASPNITGPHSKTRLQAKIIKVQTLFTSYLVHLPCSLQSLASLARVARQSGESASGIKGFCLGTHSWDEPTGKQEKRAANYLCSARSLVAGNDD